MNRIKQTKEELHKTNKKIEELEKNNYFIGRWFFNNFLERGFLTTLFIGIPGMICILFWIFIILIFLFENTIISVFLIILIVIILFLAMERYTKQKKEINQLSQRREILIKQVKKKEKELSRRRRRKHQLNELIERKRKDKEAEENLKIRENFIASQKKKDLALYSFENKEYWLSNKIINELNMIKKHIDTNFMQINPYDFEEFTKHLFGQMDYSAIQTKNTGDFGADVIAKKGEDTVLIQCKRNSVGNNVSNVIVQQTLGAMWKYEANKSIIVTTSDFTVSAHHQARNAPVELWNGTYFKKIVKEILIEEVVKKEGTIDKEEIK